MSLWLFELCVMVSLDAISFLMLFTLRVLYLQSIRRSG
nr:MAG TPA: hypothetical protein [Caudoviricetes sp.]